MRRMEVFSALSEAGLERYGPEIFALRPRAWVLWRTDSALVSPVEAVATMVLVKSAEKARAIVPLMDEAFRLAEMRIAEEDAKEAEREAEKARQAAEKEAAKQAREAAKAAKPPKIVGLKTMLHDGWWMGVHVTPRQARECEWLAVPMGIQPPRETTPQKYSGDHSRTPKSWRPWIVSRPAAPIYEGDEWNPSRPWQATAEEWAEWVTTHGLPFVNMGGEGRIRQSATLREGVPPYGRHGDGAPREDQWVSTTILGGPPKAPPAGYKVSAATPWGYGLREGEPPMGGYRLAKDEPARTIQSDNRTGSVQSILDRGETMDPDAWVPA